MIKETWTVSTTFIGTVIGAGFASGQEILRFFTYFGWGGIIGIILCTILFCLTGSTIMALGHNLKAKSFNKIVLYVCGKRLGPAMDLILSVFLFGTLSVMLAGAGALFFQQWGISFLFGAALTMIVSIITVFFGLNGITRANSIIVPIMVLICILTTFPSISLEKISSVLEGFQPVGKAAAINWPISALLYLSFNMTMSVSILAPLGNKTKNRHSLILGGIIGGIVLGILAMLINLAILSNYPSSAQFEIPSLFVAGRLAWVVQLIFSFVLWAEIYTTIIGNLFGLTARITEATGSNPKIVCVVLMGISLLFSQLGFSGLVGTIYPLLGYVSLIFLSLLYTLPARKSR
jgi:uncharacterized membrane protein YkvI